MNSIIKYVVLFILISIIVSACNNGVDGTHAHPHSSPEDAERVDMDDDTIELTQEQFDASEFEVGGYITTHFTNTLSTNGTIHLPERNRAIVSSLVGGTVSDMELLHGQWVRKGQRLFGIVNPDLIKWQQQYLEIKEELVYLEATYNRQQQLSEEAISAKKDLLKASSEYGIAKTRMAALAKKLSLIDISPESVDIQSLISSLDVVAPISGYVSDIDVVKGAFLRPSEAALQISNTNHLHVELKVLERDISKLERRQKVLFYIQDNPTESYQAEIHLIERLVGEDRMVNVHCHLDNDSEPRLIPGMYVSADIALDKREVIALPEDAVVTLEGHHYVLVRESTSSLKFNKIEVEIGERSDGKVELIGDNDFNESTIFLTTGAYFLITGESTGGHSH